MKIQGNLQVTGKGEKVTVQEIDGNPTVENVTAIKFSNGTVTDNGDGTVTVVTTGSITGTSDPGFYGIYVRESDSNPPTFRNDTLTFDSQYFYLTGSGTGNKPLVSLRPPTGSGGVTAHSALTGLSADDHTQYLLASQATDRSTFTTNWTDLTDGGTTVLHTHAGLSGGDPGFYGVIWSDGTVTKRTDRLSFSGSDFYLDGSRPTVNIKPIFLKADGSVIASEIHIGANDNMTLTGSPVAESLGINSNTQSIVEIDTASDTSGLGSLAYYARSRGTLTAKTAVVDGDTIGALWGIAHDGTDFAVATRVDFKVEGTVSNDRVPGKIDFAVTAPGAVTAGVAMTIHSDSHVEMQNTLNVKNQITAEAFYIKSLGELVNDHGLLLGLTDDDHTQYSLASGTRAFTGVVGGITPTSGTHLATKSYVDTTVGPGFYGIFVRQSGIAPQPFKNDTLIFDADYFYLQANSVGKPIISLRPPASSGSGVSAHSALTGLSADDHTQYSLVVGTRAFTGTVGGITPVAAADLTTKGYVDTGDAASVAAAGPGFYGIWFRESDSNPPAFRNDTLTFDSQYFYLTGAGAGNKPLVSLRPPVSSLSVRDIDLSPTVSNVTTLEFTNGAVSTTAAGVATITLTVGSGVQTIKDGVSTYSSQSELNFSNSDFYLSHGGTAGASVVNLRQSLVNGFKVGTFSAATEWQFIHNLGTKNILWNTFNNDDKNVIPDTVDTSDPNTAYFYFKGNFAGKAVVAGSFITGTTRDNDLEIFSFSMESVNTTNQYLEAFAPYSMNVESVSIVCKSGSCTGAFYIVPSGNNTNGISIGGLDPISISTTKQTLAPSSNSTVNSGDALLFSVPANVSAKNLRFTMTGRKV